MILTDGQEKALNALLGTRKNHLIKGSAGTGKTTLMREYIDIQSKRGKKIYVTAPTHKATRVLREKIKNDSIDVLTIHSLLSLRPRTTPSGVVLYRAGRNDISAHEVIIDEASMIGSELYSFIKKYLSHVKVVFLGDEAQLPPVGEDISKTFLDTPQTQINGIVRQAADNPLIKSSLLARDVQKTMSSSFDYLKSSTMNGEGIFNISSTSFKTWSDKAFLSEDFKKNPNSFRVIAWTNDTVNSVNANIQRLIYGEIDTPFAEGELALCRNNYSYNGVDLDNSEEIIVQSIRKSSFRTEWGAFGSEEDFDIPTWIIQTTHGVSVQMIRDHDAYDAANRYVRSKCSEWKPPADSQNSYDHVDIFHSSFARLVQNYAMTVHTAQGSTFENVFILSNDILKRRKMNLLETHKLFYTAMTRPEKRAIIVV